MSVNSPSLTVALGAVGVPQADVIEALVHLGATKEVSSWELLLENWDAKYSPGGTYPLSVGQDGYISIGRGSTVPQLITTRTESVKFESTPTEHYVRLAGRCWGEKLFRQTVTKDYSGYKGEAIVKNLLDYYSGISHLRSSLELVEDTDTTFTDLKVQDAHVWDLLQKVASESDDSGVIGYDFRIAPDAKFEFFPRGTKTSAVSLTDAIESYEHWKEIISVRNKVTIYGTADKSVPASKFSWVQSLTPTEGIWSASAGAISLDTTKYYSSATGSIKNSTGANYYGSCLFTLGASYVVDSSKYPTLFVVLARDEDLPGDFLIVLYDTFNRSASCQIQSIGVDQWCPQKLKIGPLYVDGWAVDSGFDWTQISKVEVIGWTISATPGNFWVGQLFFGGCRYSSTQQDTTSQTSYGLREYIDTDEELYSDNECQLRAKAILANMKDPFEYLKISSRVIDYGSSPFLPADKIAVVLPNENVNAYFRILSAEYHLLANAGELTVTLELGKEKSLLADYVYALRSKLNHVSRYKVARF